MYKIPQDVEADDKFVGPLSFKQFIYCGIAGVSGYLSFLSLTRGFWPVLFLFAPVIIAAGFLGFPWGRDQPTEVWLAARIRFFIKPRTRIWNQSGIKQLVTVTAPKRVDRHLTNGLSQTEVTSRLTGLADLLDSRGWAVKNVNVNLYGNPAALAPSTTDDRLIDVASLPQEVVEVTANDDVLDERSNPTAQHFDEMIKNSEEKHRKEVISQMQEVRDAPIPATGRPDPSQQATGGNADFWFLQQGAHNGQHQSPDQIVNQITSQQAALEPNFTTFDKPDLVAPHTAAPTPRSAENATNVTQRDEEALLNKIHHDHEMNSNPFGNVKTIMPLGETAQNVATETAASQPTGAAPQMPLPPVTPPVNPAIINLANNDDLNVATIARQADKNQKLSASDDEVVVSLR